MRLAVWPVAPARALGDALRGVVDEVVELEPWDTAAALRAGTVDLALVPTLDVMRDPAGLDLLPGVALAGERSPRRALAASVGLDQIETIAFGPHDTHEAVLTQLVLREHYGTQPVFRPVAPGTPLAAVLAEHGTALAPPDASLPDGAYWIDPALEFLELTLRPYVWGLVASREDEIDASLALRLRASAQAAEPGEALRQGGVAVYQITLDGLAIDGLAETAEHLFATGTLPEIPDLVFIELPSDPDFDGVDPPAEGGDGARRPTAGGAPLLPPGLMLPGATPPDAPLSGITPPDGDE